MKVALAQRSLRKKGLRTRELRTGWAIALKTIILATVLTAFLTIFPLGFAQPVLAVAAAVEATGIETATGAQVFNVHCAGCHVNGGNIVRRGKNLKLKTLQRNQVDSIAAIAQIVTNGKGIMSAYGDRLTPEEIQAVAAYVLEQAEQGWK